ncbi:MAG: hypothetical protein CSA97_04745 [Bacteroidetes bacterium]|nr:MAG: hypothetical protein CSA97_04745 [Bacteroidota bacterium]
MIRLHCQRAQGAARCLVPFLALLLLAPSFALAQGAGGASAIPRVSISFAPDTTFSVRLRAREDSTVVWLDYGAGAKEELLIWDSYSDVVRPLKGGTLSIYGGVAGLDCSPSGGAIRALEVSGCPSLEELNVEGCLLASLDLTGNRELEVLDCGANRLTALDLGPCPVLRRLDCHGNSLAVLVVSGCDSLRYLDCSKNVLRNIDLSRNPALEELYCQDNQLGILELRTNWQLRQLSCFGNNLSPLAIEGLLRALRIVPAGQQGVAYLEAIPADSMTHSLRMALELAQRKRWRIGYGGAASCD